MIDWSKEVNKVNICGWCNGSMHSCDGGCFKSADNNFSSNDLEKLRHIERELTIVRERKASLLDEVSLILKRNK